MPEADKDKQRNKSNNDYLKYSGLAFKLAGTAACCIFLGRYFDQLFVFKFPVFLLLGAILAVSSVFYILLRELR